MGNERTSTRISHDLIDFGFLCVLGTTEHVGMATGEGQLVRRGSPKTWASNNGVTCVYDEVGRPWIFHNKKWNDDQDGFEAFQEWTEERRLSDGLKCGAYVPHSNDGGHFVNEVLPKL